MIIAYHILWFQEESGYPLGKFRDTIHRSPSRHRTGMEHCRRPFPESHVTDYRAVFLDDGSSDSVLNSPLAEGRKGFDGNVWCRLKTDAL